MKNQIVGGVLVVLALASLGSSKRAVAAAPATCVDFTGTYLIDFGTLQNPPTPEGQMPLDIVQTGCAIVSLTFSGQTIEILTDGTSSLSVQLQGTDTARTTRRAWFSQGSLIFSNHVEVTEQGAAFPFDTVNEITTFVFDSSDPTNQTIDISVQGTEVNHGSSFSHSAQTSGPKVQ